MGTFEQEGVYSQVSQPVEKKLIAKSNGIVVNKTFSLFKNKPYNS
jgi:hypothetical protein